MIAKGHAAHLYDLAAQAKFQHVLMHGTFKNNVLPFNYPPYVATIFSGFGRISLETGYWVWAGINVVLAGVLVLLLRRITGLAGTEWKRFVLWVLAIAPLWSSFMGGVFSLWIAVGAAGFVLAMLDGRQFSAGLWLGLVAFKPQYVPPLLALIVARRAWKALAGALLAGVVLVGVSLPTVGLRGWRAFFNLLQVFSGNGSRYNAHAELMWSVRGLLTRLVEEGSLYAFPDDRWLALSHDQLTEKLSFACFALGLICIVAMGRRFNLRIHAAMTLCAMTILSPHGHSHDTLLMTIAVGLIWSVARMQSGSAQQLADSMQLSVLSSSVPMFLAYYLLRSSLSLLPLASFCAIACWGWHYRHVSSERPKLQGPLMLEVPSRFEPRNAGTIGPAQTL